jgi:hypothetical protein
MGWLAGLLSFTRSSRLADEGAFRRFLAAEAAHIAQQVPTDYCRARSGVLSDVLFREEPFLEKLRVCRWESYAAVLADLILLAEGEMRPRIGQRRAAIDHGLVELYAAVLASEARPIHRPEGWDDAIEQFRGRLAAAGLGPPHGPAQLAPVSGGRMFATLPIHRRYSAIDEDAILSTVELRLVGFLDALRRRLDAEAVIADLVAGGGLRSRSA